MKTIATVLLSMCIFLISGMFGDTAHAQAVRTWVSGVGDDVNPCSRTAPCKTFAGAISKTAASGEINCIDPGAFGSVTITKSIVIRCGEVKAGVLASGTNGITINAAATDMVSISGLDIEGGATGINGIRFLAGATLHVENCVIHGFRSTGANGILFSPSAGNTELIVTNTIISDNGDGATGAGILVQPTASATVRASISRTTLSNNTNGLVSDTGTSTVSGTARLTFADSVASGNNTSSGNNGVGIGLVTTASGGPINRLLSLRSTIVNNGVGLSANGLGSGILVAMTGVNGNAVGLSTVASGQLFSYLNNFVNSNTVSEGSFTGSITPQ